MKIILTLMSLSLASFWFLGCSHAPSNHIQTGKQKKALISPRSVKIYFAAGEHNSGGSCQRLNWQNCNIYRLKYHLSTKIFSPGYKQITSDATAGEFLPSISPDGSMIAYESHSGSGNNNVIWVKDLTSGDKIQVTKNGKTQPANGRFPNWNTNTRLLFHRDAHKDYNQSDDPTKNKVLHYDEPYKEYDKWGNIFEARILSYNATPFLNHSRMTYLSDIGEYLFPLILGGAFTFYSSGSTLDTTEFSFHDIATHPQDNDIVAFHLHRSTNCTSGSTEECGNPEPVVMDFSDSTKALEERMTWFDLDLGTKNTINSCAHLSFSPDGTKVICTEQSSDFNAETYEYNNGQNSISIKQDITYQFAYDSTANQYKISTSLTNTGTHFSHKALFKHKGAAELYALNNNYKTIDKRPVSEPYCNAYQHKQTQFCGSSNYIVMSVQCHGSFGSSILFSRVYLINISDPTNPVYTDLTSELENRLGKTPNSMQGWTATCHLVDSDSSQD